MRKFSVFSAAAVSLATVVGLGAAASADGYDRGSKGFVAPPAYSWSGVYMGVHGGYGWGDSDITEEPLQILGVPFPPLSSSSDVDGGLGGVQLGMNKQFGNWVVGGEFRLSGADISGSTNDCLGLSGLGIPPGVFNCDTNVNWVAAALAKLGYAQNRWLIYGTAGWAVAGVDYGSSIVIVPGFPVITLPSGENDTADGFAFGGGVEYAFTESVSFGVEYTRMELESEGSGLFLGGILSSGDREIELNTVTARLNVKWGGL
ncbi:MAG: outer membrane beta-barrel protein [Hyphomicrobium sp.]|nr:outer membrane beta-barrel protein [Hyphomicrobium sp.]